MPITSPLTAMGLIRRALRRQRRHLIGSATLLVSWQACETTVPVLIGLVVDKAVATSSLPALALWIGALVLLFLVLSTSYRFGSRLALRANQLERHALRVEISEHALAPEGIRSELLPGEVLTLATGDTEKSADMIVLIPYILASCVAIAVAAAYLVRIDLVLGLIVLVGTPLALGLTQLVSPTIWKRWSAQQERIGAASAMAVDLVRGLRPIKGIAAEATAAGRYRELSQSAKGASVRAARSYGLLSGLTVWLNSTFLAVVALVGGSFAIDGDISIGEFIAVIGLAQFLAEPVSAIGEWGGRLAASHASARRIATFVNTPPLVTTGVHTLDSNEPVLRLEEVSYGALRELDLTLHPGELVGVVTTDPAVAVALMTVLRGETEPTALTGSVRLGEHPTSELALAAVRSHLVVAGHHSDIFEGTIRSNINAVDADLLETALHASAADEVTGQFDNGVDHVVSADGSNLSGGQRQRLALARGLAAAAPMLVLHDPTTAVDAVTEQRIATGIRDLRHCDGSRIATLLLTSSPALLAQADRVVFIDDDGQSAEGRHSELVKLDAYAEAVLR